RSLLVFVDSARTVIYGFVGMGVMLAFLSLLGILGFLVLERESDYATLRAMGYGAKQIGESVFTEVGLLGLGGLLLSLPTWALLSIGLRSIMALAWFSVPVDFRGDDLGFVAIPTLAFVVLAAIPAVRQILKFSPASVL